MQITPDTKLGFKDVLIRPKRSRLDSRDQVDLFRHLKCPHSSSTISGVPIIAANMDTTGTFWMADVLCGDFNAFVALNKFYSYDDIETYQQKHNYGIFVTIGGKYHDINILSSIKNVSMICIDVANGYTESFLDTVKRVRDLHPLSFILAGNVCTPEMTEALILAGASCVKCGLGNGSSCTTRVMTGVGYPQLSTIMECADAAHGLHGHICADGGCTIPGDIAKAFGAGADLVMLGGMLSGTDECEGSWDIIDGKKYFSFRGMSSSDAMKDHNGGMADHRAAEGKTVRVEYKGSVKDLMLQILGGLRSTCTYVGAKSIKDLPKCTTFVRVTEQENQIFGSDFKWWER